MFVIEKYIYSLDILLFFIFFTMVQNIVHGSFLIIDVFILFTTIFVFLLLLTTSVVIKVLLNMCFADKRQRLSTGTLLCMCGCVCPTVVSRRGGSWEEDKDMSLSSFLK